MKACQNLWGAAKVEQIKSKVNIRKLKIREETSEAENRKSVEKTSETRSWFFEKVNKIDKPLDFPKKKRL